jgi:hypothetical protein
MVSQGGPLPYPGISRCERGRIAYAAKPRRGAIVAALAPVKATLDALPGSTAEHHTGGSEEACRRAPAQYLGTQAGPQLEASFSLNGAGYMPRRAMA